ncbi:pyridine nucleotide-disulfide oxidoreductase-domain-containing protein [Fimicolochytrium jonesii]|uniref:pyridine nucleotide-disulfide oxidoreductase-domain-containing protein n=1 Tax=Fimicolochytrium jonesii TaxID=1396493 RepID=UPI0022FDC1F2|nr:pyridine nucleotide-disulfide oxidoreductase-domain-containing protein [Fimicolochytrium jonesii]KAI8820365.1 pyridine nucleotide-disulfide oxidoreductase-domain-containing protein [Fimicolochytrium jonesii]
MLASTPLASAAAPHRNYTWCVVGAGPAGIAAVGKLLDNGVNATDIAWVDPKFDVGLCGRKWRSVWSNTSVATFTRFLEASPAFGYDKCETQLALHQMDASETCQLGAMVEPLQCVTATLMRKVFCFHDFVVTVERSGATDDWLMELDSGSTLTSTNVILAIGSKPRTMSSGDVPILPVEHALCIETLCTKVKPTDNVAVFGSSHSAIMIVRDLLACGVSNVVNFYQSPLIYAVFYPDGTILHDNTGLKGKTAEWAKANLEHGNLPTNIQRYQSTPQNIEKYLPTCTKVVYAIGFQQETISVKGIPNPIPYDNKTGIIAPGLYGVGIAFPELGTDAAGNMELKVGMWKFMDYLSRVVPKWVAATAL